MTGYALAMPIIKALEILVEKETPFTSLTWTISKDPGWLSTAVKVPTLPILLPLWR